MPAYFTLEILSPIAVPSKRTKKAIRVTTNATVRLTSVNSFKDTIYLSYQANNYSIAGPDSEFISEGETLDVPVTLDSNSSTVPASTLYVDGTSGSLMKSDNEPVPAGP